MSRSAPFQMIFRRGQRVRLTEYAKSMGIYLQARANDRGTVQGQTTASTVRVLPDGYKSVKRYSVKFWESDE